MSSSANQLSPLHQLVLKELEATVARVGRSHGSVRQLPREVKLQFVNAVADCWREDFQQLAFDRLVDRCFRMCLEIVISQSNSETLVVSVHNLTTFIPALLKRVRRSFFARSQELRIFPVHDRADATFSAVSRIPELSVGDQLSDSYFTVQIQKIVRSLLEELIPSSDCGTSTNSSRSSSEHADDEEKQVDDKEVLRQQLLGTILYTWIDSNRHLIDAFSQSSPETLRTSFESLLQNSFWLNPRAVLSSATSPDPSAEINKLMDAVAKVFVQAIRDVETVHSSILAAAKATTDALFGSIPNVIASSSSKTLLRKRHIAPAEDADTYKKGNFLAEVPLLQKKMLEWNKDDPRRVLIVGGSSGSGKTVFSLLMARSLHSAKSAYADDGSELRSAVENVIIYLTKSELRGWDENASALCSTAKRNDLVETCLVNSVACELAQFKFTPKELRPRQKHCVVIVLDELGAAPTFVRGLCAVRDRVAKLLRPMLLGEPADDENPHNDQCPQIRFIVAGTGLAVRADGYGDGSGHVKDLCSILLDEHRVLTLDDAISTFVPERYRSAPELAKLRAIAAAEKRLQLDLAAKTKANPQGQSRQLLIEEPFSASVKLAWGLFKNARCSAIFFSSLTRLWLRRFKPHQRFESFDCISEQVLSGLLPITIAHYISINGLNEFQFPENVLLCSLAACIYKFAQLPPGPLPTESLLAKWLCKRPSYQKGTEKKTLTEYLSVEGGILVDCAVDKIPSNAEAKYFQLVAAVAPSSSSSSSSSPPSSEREVATANNNNHQHVRFVPKGRGGRFLFSSSHSSMLLNTFGVVRREHNWAGFEKAVFDFVTLVAATAPYYRELKAVALQQQTSLLLRREDAGNEEEERVVDDSLFCAEAKSKDGLYRLKELLVFRDCVVPDDGKLNVYSLPNQVNMISKTPRWAQKQSGMFEFSEEAKAVLQHSCRDVKNRDTVVVMLSADLESFADVVVVGPNKLILIQCKSRKRLVNKFTNKETFSDIKVDDELAKLNFPTAEPAAADNYRAQRVYFDELCRLCHDGVSERVEVHAVLLISTDVEEKDPSASPSSASAALTAAATDNLPPALGKIISTWEARTFPDAECNKIKWLYPTTPPRPLKVVRQTHGLLFSVPPSEYAKMSSDSASNPLFPAMLQQSTQSSVSYWKTRFLF